MPLISLEDVSIRFRGPMLLDGVSATIEPGQKIGLLGRNGAGKSTLMNMIDGLVQPDSGAIVVAPRTKIRRLQQDVPTGLEGTVADVVRGDLEAVTEPEDHWQIDLAVEETLSRMQLDPNATFETLSSGMKRRVLLAEAIASKPDVLLLDEPTNHLDLESILWLEDFLSRWTGTLIFVTHDRSFLQKLATRIWEIESGRLFDWSCDYVTFGKRKEEKLAADEKQNALFDKKLAEEEVWIRQGIKARRTRNEGRVRALEAMRLQRSERQQKVGTAKLKIQEAQRSGMLVVEAKQVSFTHPGCDSPVIDDFSTTIMRGDKIGIIGRNGAGKSTLLRLLLGQLQPQTGSIRIGTNVQVAYFDQLRDTLDPEKTVQENVSDRSNTVRIGDRDKHIIGYLQDFLFTPERARTQVKFLSGGERNRVLLARLMTQPANVIVLDEPTNDLDSETLDLLEEQVVDFSGTVLVVSHDRTFLNNVVTSTIVFESTGINEYVGGYDDWRATLQRQRDAAKDKSAGGSRTTPASPPATTVSVANNALAKSPAAKTTIAQASGVDSATTVSVAKKRLSFKDQYELEQLPQRIETLEADIAAAHQRMLAPDFYRQTGEWIAAEQEKLAKLEGLLADTYRRWEQLEAM